MPLQDLSPPPPAPARSDPPEEFISKADAWLAWQETYAGEMTSLIAQLEVAAAMIATAGAYADPGLLALAGKTPAADRLPYYTGASTSALAVLTAAGRALLEDADAAAQRTTLGLGTAATQNTGAFEAAGAVSSGLAGHVAAADPHAQYLLETAVSAFMLTVLDDASAGAARTTLGIGVVSGSSGSWKISFGSFVITIRDHTFAQNATTACAYGDGHEYTSWARALVNGGLASGGQQDNGPFVQTAGLTSADVWNSIDTPISGQLISFGV